MTEGVVTYPDFSAGEIAPEMRGRFDLRVFYKGCQKVENFIVRGTGMARYRDGTRYVAPTRGGAVARLHAMDVTETFSYILEFTNGALRFHRNGAQIREAAQNITGITQANPAVVTITGHSYSNGDYVYLNDIAGMTELNDEEFVVANVAANTFELSGTDSSAFTAYSSGGTAEKIVEVTTPYDATEIFEIKISQQTGAIAYITHENYNPKKLVTTGTTSWTLTDHSPVNKTFGNAQAISSISQANPAVVTYTGSDTFSNGDKVRITDVNGMTQINDSVNDYTVANVNTGTNTFELSGVDSSGYAAYTSGGIIREVISTSSPFLSSGNYPRAVGFYEQRLIYGGSTNNPTTLYFSRAADPDDFSLGDEVDDGIEYVIAGDAGRINWLNGTERFLGIGTASDVLQATGGIDDVITPTSISIRPSNAAGVFNLQAVGQGTQIFFVQGNQLIVRSFEYDFEQNGYVPVDRNLIADHITESGITQIDYQYGRPNVLWAVRADGQLIGLTVEEDESVSGWHRHTTDGLFASIANEKRTKSYDRLWMCASRDNGYTIEYMVDKPVFPRRENYVSGTKEADTALWRNLLFEKQKEYIHLDSSLTYDGSTATASATITPAATTGSDIVFTASASIFASDMVGRQIWKKSTTGAEIGRAEITTYNSATEVECLILEDFDSTTVIPYGNWYLTADSVTGAKHLEGQTVSVVADGGQHPQITITDAVGTLARQASVIHVGLPYTGYLQTNNLEPPSRGTGQTKKKTLTSLGFRFLDTLFAKFGVSYYNLEQVYMRTAAMKMDRPPELFSGDRKVTYANQSNDTTEAGWSREKTAIVVQDQPFPCSILLLVPYVESS